MEITKEVTLVRVKMATKQSLENYQEENARVSVMLNLKLTTSSSSSFHEERLESE